MHFKKTSTRSEESIVGSHEVHIKHLLGKNWNREDAIERKSCLEYLLMMHKRISPGGVRESLLRSRAHLCLQLHRMLTTRH